MNNCLRLTDSNFSSTVLESRLPVLVEFWGSWCPPCKMMEPVMNELSGDLTGKVAVGKINIDQNKLTSSKYNISAAPTFLLFLNGIILTREIGCRSKKQLLDIIGCQLSDQTPRKMERKLVESSPRAKSTGTVYETAAGNEQTSN